jgi:hypothetical protein
MIVTDLETGQDGTALIPENDDFRVAPNYRPVGAG